MGAAVPLREDYCGDDLRGLAKNSKDSAQCRRLLALAEIYDGGRRLDAARIGGVGLQVIRDWVLRFNAAGPDGLIDRKAPSVPNLMRSNAGPWPNWWNRVRSRQSMAWCAGAWSIWHSGCGMNTASRWTRAR